MDDRTVSTSDLYDHDVSLFSDRPLVTRIQSTTRSYRARESKVAIDALQQGEPMVYAMRVEGGLIKIGCSRSLAKRRQQLDGELLSFKFGDFDDEADLHVLLSPHVHHGREWYHPTPEVIAVVNAMRAEFRLDPIAA